MKAVCIAALSVFFMLSTCSDSMKKYVMGNDVVYVNHFNTGAQLSPIESFHCPEFGLNLLPEPMIVGTTNFIWDSMDVNTGTRRWDRIFTDIMKP